MSARDFYLRFSSLFNTLTRDAGLELDFTTLQVLEQITSAHASGAPLKVSDVLSLAIASPATMHRKLDFLRANGFVSVATDTVNNTRAKWLIPTEQALAHFDALGKALVNTAKQTKKN
jgi:DNA-binding MarR family transcriptional regulator